ncbi:MAG: hypothetical protein ABJN51_13235, partial [Sneathiella sp.]
NLGHLYRRGLGVEKNFSKALSWYKRAADMGFDRAQANVGTMYLKGEGVEADFSEAAKWFTKAARNGHTIAQYNLGLMYEHGRGVEKSQSKALAWYNLASKAGHKQALNKLSILVAGDPDIKVETPESASKSVASAPIKAVPAPVKKDKDIKPTTSKAAEPKPVAAKVAPKAQTPLKKVKTSDNSEKPVSITAKPQAVAVAGEKDTAVSVATSDGQAKKKFDPFAGSANKQPTSGEATAFSKPAATEPASSESSDALRTTEKPKPKEEEKPGFFASLKSLIAGNNEEGSTPPVAKSTVKTVAPIERSAATKVVEPAKPEKAPENTPAPVVAEKSAVVATAPVKAQVAPAAKPAPTPVATAPLAGALSLSERLEMASLAYTLEEYQQALNVWAPLAQRGNAEAQYNLGVMFNKGQAVPVDRVQAYYWWEKAKTAGYQKAITSLAELEKTLTFLEKRQLRLQN